MEGLRNDFKILSDKLTGKRHSGRPMRERKDNIRIDFKEVAVSMRN